MGRFTLEQVTGRDTQMCCGYGGFLSCIHTKDLKVQYVIILSSPFFLIYAIAVDSGNKLIFCMIGT